MLLLAWIGQALFDPICWLDERRLRQRGAISIGHLAHVVRSIILVRAMQLYGPLPRAQGRRFAHMNVRHGFARRQKPRAMSRQMFGGVLRKRLAARDPLKRVARLIAALQHLDAFARKMLKRLRRRFTRLYALVAAHPPHDPAVEAVMRALGFKDSS